HLSSSIHLHVRQLHPFPTRRSSDLRYHSDEPFEFLPQHLAELEALPLTGPKYPQRYYLLACTGDEVLDWRTMANWYQGSQGRIIDRKSTRLNSSHVSISYAVFCLKQ